jgi:hypothetical protein
VRYAARLRRHGSEPDGPTAQASRTWPCAAVAPRRHLRDRGGLREAIAATSSTLSVSIANPIGHHASCLYRPVNSAATTYFQTKRPATWLDLGCVHHKRWCRPVAEVFRNPSVEGTGRAMPQRATELPRFQGCSEFSNSWYPRFKVFGQDCRTLDVPIDVATNPNRHPRAKSPWHDEKNRTSKTPCNPCTGLS